MVCKKTNFKFFPFWLILLFPLFSVFICVCLCAVCVSLDVQCRYFLKTLGQTLMVQVAKRGASVLKRRKSRNRMEPPSSTRDGSTSAAAAAAADGGAAQQPTRSESDGDVVFYMDEPRSGKLISIFYYFILIERISNKLSLYTFIKQNVKGWVGWWWAGCFLKHYIQLNATVYKYNKEAS